MSIWLLVYSRVALRLGDGWEDDEKVAGKEGNLHLQLNVNAHPLVPAASMCQTHVHVPQDTIDEAGKIPTSTLHNNPHFKRLPRTRWKPTTRPGSLDTHASSKSHPGPKAPKFPRPGRRMRSLTRPD